MNKLFAVLGAVLVGLVGLFALAGTALAWHSELSQDCGSFSISSAGFGNGTRHLKVKEDGSTVFNGNVTGDGVFYSGLKDGQSHTYAVTRVGDGDFTPATYQVDPNSCTPEPPRKVFVCKYIGTPGEDERLQTGQNPISVSVNAISEDPVVIGSYFADAQGRSYVLAFDNGQPEPDVSECPQPPDLCSNIDGNQAQIPAGLIVVDGQCVVPTCENGGIDSNDNQCHEFSDICYNGETVNVRDDDGREDTGDCDIIQVCVDGLVGDYIEYGAPTDTEDCGVVTVCHDGLVAEYVEFFAPTETGDCGEVAVCVDGLVGDYLEYGAPADTEDCGPVQVCVNGAEVTVTQYDFNNGIDTGDCGEVEVCHDGVVDTYIEYFAPEDTFDCDYVPVCVDGQDTVATEYELNNGIVIDTGDCDLIVVCQDGQDVEVTEYEANLLELEEGACPTPTPTPTPEPTVTPTATPEPTPTPCADNEERQEDGTCVVVTPPEEPTPKATTTPSPTATPVTPVASSVVQPPTHFPDTGGPPPLTAGTDSGLEAAFSIVVGVAIAALLITLGLFLVYMATRKRGS